MITLRFKAGMCHALRSREGELVTKANLQCLSQMRLAVWGLIKEETNIFANTAAREPRYLGTPNQ